MSESYYEQLCKDDIISKAKTLMRNKGYYLRDIDGKITVDTRTGWDTPWHHVKHSDKLNCHYWHSVLFDVFSMQLPTEKRFVPLGCLDCYKVVVRPKTLKQLFALLEIQKQLDRPCKLGIETRDTVHGLYGGYFYNRGLDNGIECYKVVRSAVDNNEILGPEVEVLLKRACTEFEHAIGPSDKWEIKPGQIELEQLVSQKFVVDPQLRIQPDHAITYVHRRWIEWAYKNGDSTYLEYTNGKSIYPKYVTYHHMAA